MRKIAVFTAAIGALMAASSAQADDVGVRVGPVGAGVTVGQTPVVRDHETTVVREREPRESTTVIKKEDEDGNRSKTVIHKEEN